MITRKEIEMKENIINLSRDLELQTTVLEGIVWLQEEIGQETDQTKRLLLLDLLRFTSEKHLEDMSQLSNDLYAYTKNLNQE